MSQNEFGRPFRASEIEVDAFRTILTWPLVLRPPGGTDTSSDEPIRDAIGKVAEGLLASSAWKEITDLLDHAPAALGPDTEEREERSQTYGEFVYFHDYVQSVLFGKTDAGRNPVVRLFGRDDVLAIRVTIEKHPFYAHVRRCNLYLVETGSAMLAVELEFCGLDGPTCPCATTKPEKNDSKADPEEKRGQEEPPNDASTWPQKNNDPVGRRLTLAQVMKLINRVRRSYAPHFDFKDGEKPGYSPESFIWLNDKGQTLNLAGEWCENSACTMAPPKFDDMLPTSGGGFIRREDASGRRSAPVFDWWRAILRPLAISGYEEEGAAGQPAWRHVVDDRIPVMSYILLPKGVMEKISRGDWIRLCFAEDASKKWPYPYNRDFLKEFEQKHCYDRYFPALHHSGASRYMFCGYHFCAVGETTNEKVDFFKETFVHHFRRHYFQMALLTQIEVASLLSISSGISEAVQDYRNDRKPPADALGAHRAFSRRIQIIQRDFLEFVHLFRFTGISNQIQAKEMYAKFRESLSLDALYADVKSELEAAFSYLHAVEQARFADEQAKATAEQANLAKSANSLSTIAVIGAVLGLAAAFLGMNVVFNDDALKYLLALVEPASVPDVAKSAKETVEAAASTASEHKRAFSKHLYLFGCIFGFIALLGATFQRFVMPKSSPVAARTLSYVGIFGALVAAGGVGLMWPFAGVPWQLCLAPGIVFLAGLALAFCVSEKP